MIEYSVFVKAAPPDLTKPTQLYTPAQVDVRLKAGSRAVGHHRRIHR